MRAIVVYESMYGNTHAIAEAIATGLRSGYDVRVVSVRDASPEVVAAADLIVAGGPTHAHGMVRPNTRDGAREAAAKPDSRLIVDPASDGPGLREWFEALAKVQGKPGAAFDTRISGPAFLTGRASTGIDRELREHGFTMIVEPESFLVDRHHVLVAGETERATRWAAGFAGALVPAG